MLIDLYVPIKNEIILAPFIIKYWKELPIRNIFLLDNETADGSIELIRQNFPHVYNIPHLGKFNQNTSDVFKNETWKKYSKGQVDFVIVSDIDEVIYAENINEELQKMKDGKFTIANLRGLNAWCTDENFPKDINEFIHKQPGMLFKKDRLYNKKILFDPNQIISMNWAPGCHTCDPSGNIKWYDSKIYMFHYSYLGLSYYLKRRSCQGSNLSNETKNKGWCHQFTDSVEKLTNEFNEFKKDTKSFNDLHFTK